MYIKPTEVGTEGRQCRNTAALTEYYNVCIWATDRTKIFTIDHTQYQFISCALCRSELGSFLQIIPYGTGYTPKTTYSFFKSSM